MMNILSKVLEIKTYGLIMGRALETGKSWRIWSNIISKKEQ